MLASIQGIDKKTSRYPNIKELKTPIIQFNKPLFSNYINVLDQQVHLHQHQKDAQPLFAKAGFYPLTKF